MNEMNEKTPEARIKALEAENQWLFTRLRDVELTLDVLAKEKLRKSPEKFADAIYSLIASCGGYPLQKKRILTILGGSHGDFAKARKLLITQGRMVDGTGHAIAADKICLIPHGYVIYTPDEVKAIRHRRARRHTDAIRKKETECC